MAKKETEDLLVDIKKLLILALIKQGVTGRDIANTLEVDPAIISRLISPKPKMKRIKN